jgi:hypothetical protein
LKRSRKKGDSLVHYAVHKKDRQAWGGPTLCGKKRVSATFDIEKVTCSKCMVHTNWTPEQYKEACKRSLIFCPSCDRGELVVTDWHPMEYEMSCSNCDHKERRRYGSLTI